MDAHHLQGASNNPGRGRFFVIPGAQSSQRRLRGVTHFPEILMTTQGGRCYQQPIVPEVETEAAGADVTASRYGRVWTQCSSVSAQTALVRLCIACRDRRAHLSRLLGLGQCAFLEKRLAPRFASMEGR